MLSKADPFEEFSAGKVACSYHIIEHIGDHRLRGRVTFVLVLCGWAMCIHALTVFRSSWIPIALILLPIVFSGFLMRYLFPYRVLGRMRFKSDNMAIALDAGPHWSVDLRTLESLGVGISIADSQIRQGRGLRTQRAYWVEFLTDVGVYRFHVLNALALGAQEKMEFMRPPPSFIGTLDLLKTHYRVRFHDEKGRGSPIV